MRVRVLHTPGHTHHPSASPRRRFGCGVGSVHRRVDALRRDRPHRLVGPHDTVELTHAQFRSVRRLAAELPADTAVTRPTGSAASARPPRPAATPPRWASRAVNPALTLAEQDYVDTLLAGLDAYPAYYAHMGPMNRRGPAPVDLSPPEPVQPAELRRRIEAGEWVVDLRDRTAFAAGHLAGSRGFELSDNFVTYLGWLYHYGTPLTLIGGTAEQVTEARRELVRIGIDGLAGAATGDIGTLADGRPLRSYRVADFAELATARAGAGAGPRRPPHDERNRGFVAGSRHIPLHELADRLGEVPEGEVWIYCGTGYRASIAASILDEPGRQVVLINDDYEAATAAGLENDHREGAAPDDAAADAVMQH